VATLSEIGEKYGNLISDPNEQFKPIIAEYTKQLEEVEKQEPVPKSMSDMMQRYQNRLDALEKSPLPFMAAAAAAISGGYKSMIHAMIDAMGGFVAGDEKVKNQGLKIMGEMVDLDVNIKTLEAKQRESKTKARNALLEARQAALKGQRDRETALLQLASREQQSLRQVASDKAKLEDKALTRANQLKIGTFKTQAEIDQFDRLLAARKKDSPNESQFEAYAKVLAAMNPRSQNFSALNYQAKKDSAVDDFFNKSDGVRKIIDEYNAANPKNRIGRQNMSPENIAKAIRSVGIDRLPSNADIRRQILQDPRSGMSGGTGSSDLNFKVVE
jgi:hypothetical protein